MWAPCFGGTLSRGRFSSKTRRRRVDTCLQPSETPVQQVMTGKSLLASPCLLSLFPEDADVVSKFLDGLFGHWASVQARKFSCVVFTHHACCFTMVMLLRQERRLMRS